jgi:1-aminocyclopropane-1-carboxylate deaminase
LLNGFDTIVSMGGAHSNHLHALAFAGKSLKINTIGYVRGEQPDTLSPTLLDLQNWGMELRFVSRSEYRQLRLYKTHDSLPNLNLGEYWLPEGGFGELALQGVGEVIEEINIDFDLLVSACGTGTTLAGLIAFAPQSAQILGVAALKGAAFLNDDVKRLLVKAKSDRCHWQILLDYHCGGFAKATPILHDFIHRFQSQHAIALEPIYTGKTLLAIFDLLKQGYFQPGQRIIMLHTGGLQGLRYWST